MKATKPNHAASEQVQAQMSNIKQPEDYPLPHGPKAEGSKPALLSLTAALQLLQYLNARKVLCTACGYRLATKENTYHSVCQGCSEAVNQTYTAKRKASDLDQVLCKRLTTWAEHVLLTGSEPLLTGNGGGD